MSSDQREGPQRAAYFSKKRAKDTFPASEELPICLVTFATVSHHDPALVLIANRDEFHARPAAAMDWWPGADVLAGRDLEAGGTWLAVSRSGRLAAVTNFREFPPAPGERSRGELPLLALSLADPWTELPARVAAEGEHYGGFNLIVAEGDRILSVSNRDPGVLMPQGGVHAVSNGPLDGDWPKTRLSRERLSQQLAVGRLDEASLLAITADESVAADADLPDTGIGQELERFLSPCFIRGERYGTRATTLAWIGARGAEVVERRFGPDGRAEGRSHFTFRPGR